MGDSGAATGEKEWVDATIPIGSSRVMYRIQAARSTQVGPWADCEVNFGVTSSGETTASITETDPTPKIAA